MLTAHHCHGNPSEATEAAASYITTLLATPDYSRGEWAESLFRLGEAQRHAGESEAAVENYLLAIEIYHDEGDRLSENLIDPLTGAAHALADMREYNPAIELFERAVHLQHVNFGPSHPAQADSLQSLSDLYMALGDHDRALASQRAVTTVYSKNYPDDDLRKLPALMAEADMQAKTGNLVTSHLNYRRIIAFIERADGDLSPELLDALFRISDLLVNNEIKDGYDGHDLARRYIERALYIVDNNEDISSLQRADAYIAAGDFLASQTPQRDKALRRYRTAWDILVADESLNAELIERFSDPTLINEVPTGTPPAMKMLIDSLAGLDPQPSTIISMRFDVDDTGTPRNIEIIEGDPSGYWDEIFERHVGKFVYRPRFDNGEPVVTEGLGWSMAYLPSEAVLPE